MCGSKERGGIACTVERSARNAALAQRQRHRQMRGLPRFVRSSALPPLQKCRGHSTRALVASRGRLRPALTHCHVPDEHSQCRACGGDLFSLSMCTNRRARSCIPPFSVVKKIVKLPLISQNLCDTVSESTTEVMHDQQPRCSFQMLHYESYGTLYRPQHAPLLLKNPCREPVTSCPPRCAPAPPAPPPALLRTKAARSGTAAPAPPPWRGDAPHAASCRVPRPAPARREA